MESNCSWSTSSVVRGYHVYKNVWTPSIGEQLQLRRQDHERSCRERREGIVGHVPREMSRTYWHFIMHGGSVGCEITGRRTLGKGGEGRINEGDAFTIPILSMWKSRGGGGGRINDGGRSDSTLRYINCFCVNMKRPNQVQTVDRALLFCTLQTTCGFLRVVLHWLGLTDSFRPSFPLGGRSGRVGPIH